MKTRRNLTQERIDKLHQSVSLAKNAAYMICTGIQRVQGMLQSLENHLAGCGANGGKAEGLQRSRDRLREIREGLNGLEIASFCGITVKRVCEQVWENTPK